MAETPSPDTLLKMPKAAERHLAQTEPRTAVAS
jgi:hypothetical protein